MKTYRFEARRDREDKGVTAYELGVKLRRVKEDGVISAFQLEAFTADSLTLLITFTARMQSDKSLGWFLSDTLNVSWRSITEISDLELIAKAAEP